LACGTHDVHLLTFIALPLNRFQYPPFFFRLLSRALPLFDHALPYLPIGSSGKCRFFAADLELSLDVIRCLVQDLRADVNQLNEVGATALLIASKIGCLEMVRSLTLKFGADVNQARDDGIAPLLMAAFNIQ
jgi:hypothetical protein